MFDGIKNWAEDKATGYLRTGIQAGGSLAGNAVGGIGGLVENAGKSAASTVQGGIGGVGSYINGYGETVKRSMSADGPVSSAQKKTAVKPGGPVGKPPPAQKALPSRPTASTAQKGPPSSVGAQKSLPAPRSSAPATRSGATSRPVSSTKPPPNSRVGGSTAAKSQGPVGASKPGPNSAKSNTNSSGKVVPSLASRPQPVGRANPGASAPKKTSDFLGIGEKYGDPSKMRPNTNQSKGPSGAAPKPSAADPLAMGDLQNIGKKK